MLVSAAHGGQLDRGQVWAWGESWALEGHPHSGPEREGQAPRSTGPWALLPLRAGSPCDGSTRNENSHRQGCTLWRAHFAEQTAGLAAQGCSGLYPQAPHHLVPRRGRGDGSLTAV